MKSFGDDLLNKEDVLPVLQTHRDELVQHMTDQVGHIHDQLTEHKKETIEALNATSLGICSLVRQSEERIIDAVNKRITRNQTTVLLVLFSIFLVTVGTFAKLMIMV